MAIPVETLEALGVLKPVTGHREDELTGHDQSETVQENTWLWIDNVKLRTENEGLKQLLAERNKVVVLLEQRPAKRPHFWQRWRQPTDQPGGITD